MNKKIIIGARGSKLSLSYAEKVKKLFFLASGKEKAIEIQIIKTSGDIFHDKKISDIGGKNIFCKEIENQLLDKKVDIAVHSLKDMDSFEENDLIIGAYLKRNDPRDGIVLKNGKSFDSDNLTIGSSSKRRELQFKSHFKNIKCKNIRGNIDSRISKVKRGEYDGTILALAGIQTLKLDHEIKEIFSEEKIIPCAGQGVIAVQCRKDDFKNLKILEKINDQDTKICALTERSLLKTIGGDCHTAVGVYAKIDKNNIIITSQLFSDDGLKSFSIKQTGEKKLPVQLGISAGKELLQKSEGYYKKKKMNIILTRPLNDTENLMQELFNLGHKIMHIPTLKISSANLDPIKIQNYNALIFTSSNAVRNLRVEGERKKILSVFVLAQLLKRLLG